MRKVMVIGAHGMLQRMLCRCTCELHGNSGNRAAICHPLTGLQIIPIFDCTGQIFCNALNRRECNRLTQNIDAVRFVGLLKLKFMFMFTSFLRCFLCIMQCLCEQRVVTNLPTTTVQTINEECCFCILPVCNPRSS